MKIKFSKMNVRDKILKPENKGHVTYRGTQIKMTRDFLPKTIQRRRQWSNILKMSEKHPLFIRVPDVLLNQICR